MPPANDRDNRHHPSPPLISIIVPTYNAASYVAAQLSALRRELEPSVAEIIVADNGSTDDTRRIVESQFASSRVDLVDASARRGAGAARNIGVSYAHAQRLCFLDADDVVLPGWGDAVLALPDDTSFAIMPTVDFFDGEPLPSRVSASSVVPTHMGFLPYARGCQMIVDRTAFLSVGGFTEAYLTGQDVALSWKLQIAGYKLSLAPGAVIAYRRRATVSQQFKRWAEYGFTDPFLYRDFRRFGVSKRPLRENVRVYCALIARLPFLFRRTTRIAWIRQLGRRYGRLRGSFAARCWYP